ncbi:MAG: excinuclease ABC subunit UvrC [Exilispira sp.]
MVEAKFYNTLPEKSGVYLFYDKNKILLYIGKAKNLKKRVSSYFSSKNHDQKTEILISNIYFIDYRISSSEFEALLLEQNLVTTLKPKYNIQLKDDKSYTLIAFTREKFPSLSIIRQKDKFDGPTFGPYLSRQMTDKLYEFIQNTFKIRTCRKKLTKNSKPCLNYHIGKCSAPCASLIDENQYLIQYKKAVSFLKGEYQDLLKEIELQINNLIRSMEFEKASILKNQYMIIKEFQNNFSYNWTNEGIYDFIAFYLRDNNGYITLLRSTNGIKTFSINKTFTYIEDKDEFDSIILQAIISIYSNIEQGDFLYIPAPKLIEPLNHLLKKDIQIKNYKSKVELKIYKVMLLQLIELYKQSFKIALFKEQKKLKELQNILNLKKLPYKIDGFDISNIGSSYIVGSSVSFLNGFPDKSNYRHFTLKTIKKQDDYAALEEIVLRRILEYNNTKSKLPDLIILDGGKGHVKRISEIINQEMNIDIPIIGLAKREETIIIEKGKKELKLPLNNEGLKLLVEIRNEAHRFANRYRKIKINLNLFKN